MKMVGDKGPDEAAAGYTEEHADKKQPEAREVSVPQSQQTANQLPTNKQLELIQEEV